MRKINKSVIIPLTNTGRKYGYILWKKIKDKEIKKILGNKNSIDLQIGKYLQKDKRIDWKRRRIGITYTLTRNLSLNIDMIRLQKVGKNKLLVSFDNEP